MAITYFTGKVTFVNYEKQIIEITFESGGKVRTITGKVDIVTQKALVASKRIKRIHYYQSGDVVNFSTQRSETTDKMVAVNILFKHNEAIDMLVNKSKILPVFKGFVKAINDKYFVKEVSSYAFLPIELSQWQMPPVESEKVIEFTINEAKNKEKVTVQLVRPKFIKAYFDAQDAFKNKRVIAAQITKVTEHGIYVNVFGKDVTAKLAFKDGYKVDDTINIKIDFLNEQKIVVSLA